MFVNKFGKVRGLDNRAVGSPTDRENPTVGNRTVLDPQDSSEFTPGQTVSQLALVGDIATLDTGAGHGLVAGKQIRVDGAVQVQYNGDKTLLSASGTTMTFNVYGAPVTPATGTITYRPKLVAR